MISLNCVLFSSKIYFSFSFCFDFNLKATVIKTDKIRGFKQLFTPWFIFIRKTIFSKVINDKTNVTLLQPTPYSPLPHYPLIQCWSMNVWHRERHVFSLSNQLSFCSIQVGAKGGNGNMRMVTVFVKYSKIEINYSIWIGLRVV